MDSKRLPRLDLSIGIDSQILGGIEGLGIGPTLSWEIDLFSKIANAVAAADQKTIPEFVYKQTGESLAGLITKTWVLVSNEKNIKVTMRQYALNSEIYKMF